MHKVTDPCEDVAWKFGQTGHAFIVGRPTLLARSALSVQNMTRSQKAGEQTLQDSRTRILEFAERLIRTRGYHGFSYADIAEAAGTTKANVHYHFGTKEDLGKALIFSTKDLMQESIANFQSRNAIDLLKHYISFFEHSIDGDLVCLCGMLLAEDDGLPPQLRDANQDLVDWQLNWLEHVLSSGRDVAEIAFDGTPREQANFVYSTIQGAHIVAKVRKDRLSFSQAMQHLLSRFEPHRI